MALINCSECGKEVSDMAQSCPNCGNPLNVKLEEHLCCPRCHSRELHSEQKGFSGGKAFAGAVLTGGIGLLAGTIGSKDVQITCLKCGKKFKAGEAVIVKSDNLPFSEDKLVEMVREGSVDKAVQYYKDKTGLGFGESARYVRSICDRHNIDIKKGSGSGCMSVIALLVILTASIVYALM